MSAEARYFRVGLFVFSGALLIGSCAVVLGGRDFFKEQVLVESYFDESVDGLEVGSPIKLRGVPIGAVKRIGFVRQHYALPTAEALEYGRQVYVLMDITPLEQRKGGVLETPKQRVQRIQAMIEDGMRLRLASQGVTGLKFIEADFVSPEKNPPMKIAWTPEHLYVPSAPSTFAALTSAAERIFSRLEDVEVEKVVANLDALIVSLTSKVNEVEVGEVQGSATALLADLRSTSSEFREALVGADVPALVADARSAIEQLDAAMVRARRMLDSGQYDFQVALENIRVASENLSDLTETARSYPSLLLLGDPPAPSEVSAQ